VCCTTRRMTTEEEEVLDSVVTSSCSSSSCWWCSFEIDHMAQCDLDGLKDARRSRTAARSESSTLPTHRPAIESSSSSTLLASSMMVHIDDDLVAKRTWCRQAIDWLQSHALDSLPRRRRDLDARRMQLHMASRCRNRRTRCDGLRE